MPIIRIPKHKYVAINNALARDSKITFEARGLLLYLLSHQDNWTINRQDIINSSPSGKKKIDRVIHELIDAGYLEKMSRRRLEGGKWDMVEYILHEKPHVPKRDTKKDL